MRLRVLFYDYDPNDGTVMPNAIAVTDEFMEDEHGGIPPYYDRDYAKSESDGEVREAFIDVPDSEVLALFATPTLRASAARPSGADR